MYNCDTVQFAKEMISSEFVEGIRRESCYISHDYFFTIR